MKIIKSIPYIILQWTWGVIQSLMGLFLILTKYRKCKKEFFHGAILVHHTEKFGGVSLGMFIFVNATRGDKWFTSVKSHEYGHTIQSLILGPLYLLIIGIPSMIWCNNPKYIKLREEKGISYYDFYPEKWANLFGKMFTGIEVIV